MEETNLEDTIPSQPDNQDTSLTETQQSKPVPEEPEQTPPPKKPKRLKQIFLGVFIFLTIVGVGILYGWNSAVDDRLAEQESANATWVANQFTLGLQDMENHQFTLARLRFEKIIKFDPYYPGVSDQLVLALQAERATATPTFAPTMAPTPTRDIRGEKDIFDQALLAKEAEDWDTLLSLLDSLRKNNSSYRTIEVDGLYYTGLRNRAQRSILIEGNLEGGIYDLTRAEQFGPLDIEAQSLKQWSIWYLTGASFWEINWGQAVQYFSLVAQVAPNLSDSSYFTAANRLTTAQVNYGAQLVDVAIAQQKKKLWCDSSSNYQDAYQWVTPVFEPDMRSTASAVREKCQTQGQDGG